MQVTETPSMYLENACYFLETAFLASEHAQSAETEIWTAAARNNFESVIIGTHHAFAAELLIKGIMLAKRDEHVTGHNLETLLKHEMCEGLHEKIKRSFADTPTLTGKDFDQLLFDHSKIFVQLRYPNAGFLLTLDMDFTSFLCKALRDELRALC